MRPAANVPAPAPTHAPAPIDDPEAIPKEPQDPEKGRIKPVTPPGKSEHPKQ